MMNFSSMVICMGRMKYDDSITLSYNFLKFSRLYNYSFYPVYE